MLSWIDHRSINFGFSNASGRSSGCCQRCHSAYVWGRVTGCGQVSSFRILKGLCMAMPFRPTWPHLSLHVVHMNLSVVCEIFYWDFRAEDAFKSHMGKLGKSVESGTAGNQGCHAQLRAGPEPSDEAGSRVQSTSQCHHMWEDSPKKKQKDRIRIG